MIPQAKPPDPRILALSYHALVEGGAGPRRHALLAYLCNLVKADFLRLVHLGTTPPGEVISTGLWANDPSMAIPLVSRVDPNSIPDRVSILHHHPLLGLSRGMNPQPQSSLVLPFGSGHRAAGFLEWVWKEVSIRSSDLENLLPSLPMVRETYRAMHGCIIRQHALYLERSAAQYEHKIADLLFRFSNDLVFTLDRQGRIIHINHGGRQILGINQEEEVATLELVSPEWTILLAMAESLDVIQDLELLIRVGTGEEVFFHGTLIPDKNEVGDVIYLHGFCKSIQEHISAQRELWVNNIKLNQLNEELTQTRSQSVQQEKLAAIGQLAAGVAHEINNPLGFIKSNHESLCYFLEKLYTYLGRLESQVPEYKELRAEAGMQKIILEIPQLLKESSQGFERIVEIVRALKNFSRMEEGRELTRVDINKLLEDTLVISRNNWKYVARIETDYRLDAPVEAWPSLLNQVFLNLIVNAAQAIESLPEDQRKDLGTIRVETAQFDSWAEIRISDSGPGIPKEQEERIFDPFFTTKPVGLGTGLGLSVSYDIVVKKHEGILTVDTGPLGGARFTLRLPLWQGSVALDPEGSPD